MMKKMIAAAMAMVMLMALAACGSSTDSEDTAKEVPDLTAYYEDFMTSLGEDNTPAMISALEDPTFVDSFFPGLSSYELNQCVLQMAAMSQVGFELDLVECTSADDVEAVKEIFQARMDSQIAGGAFYPAVAEAWEKGEIIVNGNVVALIVAGEAQADAVEAFNNLFA